MAQENYTSVWVFAANVDAVDGQQGFVEVSESVAKKLIADGLAQDPGVGGFDLKYVEDASKPVKKNGKKADAEPAPAPAPEAPKPEPAPALTKQVVPEPTPVASYKTK